MGFNDFVSGKELVEKAKAFAIEKHGETKRKFSGEPYINHPEAVASLVEKNGGSADMIAAAWLHDVVEDCGVSIDEIKKMFGNAVAFLVNLLTLPSTVKKENKNEYLAMAVTGMSSDALTIKLCDRLNNVSDFSTASPKFVNKYAPATKFILDALEESGRVLNSAQKRLVHTIRKEIEPYLEGL